MEGAVVRVSMPVLWSSSSSSSLHETNEEFISTLEIAKCHTHYLSGRYPINRENIRSNLPVKRFPHFPPSETRLHYKSQKVSFQTSAGNRIFGDAGEFCNNKNISSKREGSKNIRPVSGTERKSPSISFRIDKLVRQDECYITGPPSRTALPKVPSTTTDSRVKGKPLFPEYDNSKQGESSGSGMMDSEFAPVQWKEFNSTLSRYGDINRCLNDRMGGTLSGDMHWGQWSSQERDLHINILELKLVKLAILTFTKLKKPSSIYLKMDNIVALSYVAKMGGGHKEQSLLEISKGNLGVSPFSQDIDYGRVSSKPSKHRGRLGVQKLHGLQRMEAFPNNSP